ncbi:response regulator transcription factor [Glaciecola petra]|uniref:Response regulator transcription factor n=1 Tax=Glaciecola petra TaxID=3075602 RepID=A0ABU2ZWH1_9ALTE|nr:response regulator transcription factor [Aestuariibacter sp. P117]MDT0596363.1 response regulator transcription factor [Aestuariibacter sp. P117]
MKILVVDDHALFRDGLKHVLVALVDAPNDELLIYEANTSEASIPVLKENPDIDLVLVDLNMPGQLGFVVLEYCRTYHSTIPIVVVSASNRKQDIQQAMDLGAMAYVPKDTTSKLMINILGIVMSGGLYFPQIVSDESKPFFTSRQLQVLTLIVEGQSNKVIAANMEIAEATIKMHVTAIFKKLGVSNRTQAALLAKEQGIFS